jgi:3-methyladenine DNA glycosylase AlkD
LSKNNVFNYNKRIFQNAYIYTIDNQACKNIKDELKRLANPKKAKSLQRFFKTGIGQYAENDIFIGISVPELRRFAKTRINTKNIALEQVEILLCSEIHEERMLALLILIEKFKRSDSEGEKAKIVKFYLGNIKWINNWDLVDLSAPSILGAFLMERRKESKQKMVPPLLLRLARSRNIWARRIAIVSTLHFIRNNEFEDTLKIAQILITDDHDLIRKAVGWMLREIGKRNTGIEESFLLKHHQTMPRIMLRYAIERFSEEKRQLYYSRTR